MIAKANKDVIKVTLTQYELDQAFKGETEYHKFIDELMLNIEYAERNYRLKGDKTFHSFMYDQWLKRSK